MSGGVALIDIGLNVLQSVIYTIGELPTSVTARNTTQDDRFFNDIEGSLEWAFGFLSQTDNKMAARDIFLIEKIYESMETEKSVSLRWLPEVLHRV